MIKNIEINERLETAKGRSKKALETKLKEIDADIRMLEGRNKTLESDKLINEKLKDKKTEKKLKINSKLTPDINTIAPQLKTNKIDCPRSGWSIRRIMTEIKSKKLNIYFTFGGNFMSMLVFVVIAYVMINS